jgi:hypothetical protein
MESNAQDQNFPNKHPLPPEIITELEGTWRISCINHTMDLLRIQF